MIQNENHPEDPFVAELEAKLHRWKNPPWWDLVNRWSNHCVRLEKAYVEDDPKGRRWLRLGAPLRMLVGMALVFGVILTIDPTGLQTLLLVALTAMIPAWAMFPFMRAQAYQGGYLRGEMAGLTQAREMLRQPE